MIIRVYGKVNLALNVTGKMQGLHTLDMVETSISLYDEIEVNKSQESHIEFTFGDNFVQEVNDDYYVKLCQATSSFYAKYGKETVSIKIKKGIPFGAGLGGGSAPIVGIIKALALMKGVEPDKWFLLSLGSDVPYMYEGGLCRVSSLGQVVEHLEYKPMKLLLAIPESVIDTKECFTMYDKINIEHILKTREIESIIEDVTGADLFNDLEGAAFMLNEEIENTMLEVRNNGFEPHMSGSGSAVFSIIEPETEIDEELYISCETVESGIKIIDKNF